MGGKLPDHTPASLVLQCFIKDRTLRRVILGLLIFSASVLGLWLSAEIVVRLYLQLPIQTGFYTSLPRESIIERRSEYGVKIARGKGWAHLGWIADPEIESYRVIKIVGGAPVQLGNTRYGSFLIPNADGVYQIWIVPDNAEQPELLQTVEIGPKPGDPPVFIPSIAGEWRTLFRPELHGDYINDHTVYQDGVGSWRLVGITSKSDGDFNAERYFAVGVSPEFPPEEGMEEDDPVGDFGELAWAPHVTQSDGKFHMFWSPHKLHQMESPDGIAWDDHRVTMSAPKNPFFRDPMVLQVAPDQWLLYTTARGPYFSRIDIYQSFNLEEWQYIRSALQASWGSERNSPFSSMESPFVTEYQDRYYLSLTYNNDSFFWPGILMLFKIWPDPESYNNTLVFHSDNPYDFGVYRGAQNSPTLLTQLEAHAAEIVYQPAQDSWYITTAGWPWVATLTSGEAAVAPLEWLPLP